MHGGEAHNEKTQKIYYSWCATNLAAKYQNLMFYPPQTLLQGGSEFVIQVTCGEM